MNPIARKIKEMGGTILLEPLLDSSGEINPKCADELFDALEHPQRRRTQIWKAIKKIKAK